MPSMQRSVAPLTGQPHIKHFTHQHPLYKLFKQFEFQCDGCNTLGYGMRYRCSDCDFDLHEQCATSPHLISSHLHPQHHLMLVNRPANLFTCSVCGNYANGLSYTCRPCDFDLHPLCTMSLTLNPGANDNQPEVINHSRFKKPVRWFKKCLSVGRFAASLLFTCATGGTIPIIPYTS